MSDKIDKTDKTVAPAVRRYRGRIGLTLIVAFVLFASVPLLILTLLGMTQITDSIRQQAINQLTSVSELKLDQIHDWLQSRQDTLNLFLADDNEKLNMLNSLRSTTVQSLAIAELTPVLEGQLKVQTPFTEFFLYDVNGNIRVSTNARQIGKIVTSEPYFQASLQNDQAVQAPFYEVGAGELNMIVTHTVVDNQGVLLGVLAGRLNLSRTGGNINSLAENMARRSGLGETGETYLVSLESNYLVTATRFEGYPLTQAYHSLGIDNALKGQNGAGVYTDFRGVPVVGVYRWVPDLQVAMLAEIDESEVLAPAQGLRIFGYFLIGFAILAALVAGSLVTAWIVRPILALTRAATAIAGGNYTHRVPVRRRNEIGLLSDTFNTMTDKLVRTIDELNSTLEEIRQTKEMVRAKDVFLATMSHELRTPLNAIIGFLGIMNMSKTLDDKNRNYVQRSRANAERLLALINDILEISRIESGRLQLVSDPIPVAATIEKLRSQMSVLAEQKGLNFTVNIDESVPATIYLDHDALIKIVTNLLGNAFKFTEKGSVALKLTRQGDDLQISVADTGIGIPAHMQDVIFESFRQVDGSSTRAYGGSGLGLSIVRQLCQAMNGSVRVNSTLGQGSTFTATLPLEVSATPEAVVS